MSAEFSSATAQRPRSNRKSLTQGKPREAALQKDQAGCTRSSSRQPPPTRRRTSVVSAHTRSRPAPACSPPHASPLARNDSGHQCPSTERRIVSGAAGLISVLSLSDCVGKSDAPRPHHLGVKHSPDARQALFSVEASPEDIGWPTLIRGFDTATLLRKETRADGETRTPDPIITSDVLYQLSYVGGARILAAFR